MDEDLNWPSDAVEKQKPKSFSENLMELGKIALSFADEAILGLIIVYIVYRVFS
ncbi:MAG: hypothetical protein KKD39_08750 [Candidatus Altiarchaeota archaeon]|nr:hypothetical protein [Candidatus Altiarchaeota archaeon]